MKGVINNFRQHTKVVNSHLKVHHKKYVFWLISAALLYKVASLIIAAIFIHNIWYSFADDIVNSDPELITDEEVITDEEDIINEEVIIDEEEIVDEEETLCESKDIRVLSPLSGDVLRWEFDIIWNYNNVDCDDESFIIKLRDANTQYITIWETVSNSTWITFDSSLLYSGFYNITWLNSSGNVINTHTGIYEWNNTRYFSWHKIVIYKSNLDVLYEWDPFTIDNDIPTIDNVVLSITWSNSWYVWLNAEAVVSFKSSEELTWVLVNILWVNAILQKHSGNNYEYVLELLDDNTEGNIIYNIEFQDLAGNTGYIERNSDIIFDKTIPEITKFRFRKSSSNLILNLDSDELSKINFVYSLSWNNTWNNYQSNYLTSHSYSFTGFLTGQYYNYSISIRDLADNIWYIGWYFKLSWDNLLFDYWNIGSGSMLVGLWFNKSWSINTGNTGNLFANTLRAEIERFNACTETIAKFNTINMPIWSHMASIKMPELEKAYVRKLVSAFSIVLFERVESAWLDKAAIDKVTQEFNDFLIILKLVRDDDNQCEQNLSNYYMSKFRNTLGKYDLTTE